MSFQERYENAVATYKQRIRDYDKMKSRRDTASATYDPDRRAVFLPQDHPLRDDPVVIRNSNIFDIYDRVTTKKHTEMREMEKELDRIAGERFMFVEQPDRSMGIGEIKGVVRRDHSERAMRHDMLLDRTRDVLNRMEGTVTVDELLALAGLTGD